MDSNSSIKFIHLLFSKVKDKDRAFLANIRSADSANLRYLAFDSLANCQVPLQEKYYLPLLVLGASIVRKGVEENGTLTLGKALRDSFPDKDENDLILQGRLRRLLSCDSSREFCIVLRSNLKLIESKLGPTQDLDYINLFFLIMKFDWSLQQARETLAMDFYRQNYLNKDKERDDGSVSK